MTIRAERAALAPLRRELVAAAVPALAVFVGLLLLVQHHWSPLMQLDGRVTDGLHSVAVRHHTFVLAMKGISLLGTSTAYVVVVARLLLHLLWQHRVRASVFAVVTVAAGTTLNALVKSAVGRARPVFVDPVAHAGHSSFPSGHAQGVAVAAGVLLLLLLPLVAPARRRLVVGATLGWAVLMAFSRVALGVHYLSDVVAGLALGATWVLLCAAAFGPSQLRETRT